MLTTKIEAAFVYAAIAHAGQCRKGRRIPFLSHLMAVAGQRRVKCVLSQGPILG
ncbi:hypothetical protein [Thioalkalivibrio sp. XN8]|uniref:hypothetical protein n=1 Tax=Thioalkalivibrio sp. XN8 TaxID=2712863 RepID=UPI0013EDDDE9|nr:hypothetical protein [Thioalkalivibrio sp. XN8]NGP51970.1 hypothetical protein [Thioalkalivibrio sp. XN8]